MREERGSSNINYLPSSWDLGAILLPADCLIFNKPPISTKLNCVYYSLNTEPGETSRHNWRETNKYKIIYQELLTSHFLPDLSLTFLFRRQTAEEREQERQAAAKYFLSMQMSGLDGPDSPPSPPAHMLPPATSPSPSPPPPSTSSSSSSVLDPPHPQSLSALQSLKPWTESQAK